VPPKPPHPRFSINQITVPAWDIPQLADACIARGIDKAGLWRHKVEETGLQETIRILGDSDIKVTSLCRGGMFPAASEEERRRRIDDNLKGIEEAEALGTDVLTLVCGPSEGQSLAEARSQVRDGIEAIIDTAREANVKLGIEPLHPMMIDDRSVIVTLKEANDLAAHFEDTVGVTIDAYHVFWDVELELEVGRASGRILSYQISDWVIPIEGGLTSRGMPGDGSIDLKGLSHVVDDARYTGPIEVEILSTRWWETNPDEVLDLVLERFSDCVA